MSGDSTRKELETHFRSLGLRLGASPVAAEKRLRALMGQNRYKCYLDATERFHRGDVGISGLYRQIGSLEEAYALFSHQSDVVIASHEWLHSRVAPFISESPNITELGCYVGGFSAWLAQKYPGVTLTGVDREENLLDLAERRFSSIPNLKFAKWDYSDILPEGNEKASILVCSLGIDFEGIYGHCSLDPLDLTSSEHCRAFMQMARPYFANWKLAIREGGWLYTVLRLGNIESLVGVVQAAQCEGWSLDAGRTGYVEIPGESFPALSFRATTGDSVDSDLLLSKCFPLNEDLKIELKKPIEGHAALILFRALRCEGLSWTAECRYVDGHILRRGIGRAGILTVVLDIATTGFWRIILGIGQLNDSDLPALD